MVRSLLAGERVVFYDIPVIEGVSRWGQQQREAEDLVPGVSIFPVQRAA